MGRRVLPAYSDVQLWYLRTTDFIVWTMIHQLWSWTHRTTLSLQIVAALLPSSTGPHSRCITGATNRRCLLDTECRELWANAPVCGKTAGLMAKAA
jgi:hypothetical protein